MPSFLADGTKFVDPIPCIKCRAPDPDIPGNEIQTFQCIRRGFAGSQRGTIGSQRGCRSFMLTARSFLHVRRVKNGTLVGTPAGWR
jgi:hypothetical protein